VETLYTLTEVVKLHSGLTRKAVQNWVARGWLKPTERLGGRNLFSERNILECRVILNQRGQELSRRRSEALRQRNSEKRNGQR
jgi:DNA-binding transcriptional MerR regulator